MKATCVDFPHVRPQPMRPRIPKSFNCDGVDNRWDDNTPKDKQQRHNQSTSPKATNNSKNGQAASSDGFTCNAPPALAASFLHTAFTATVGQDSHTAAKFAKRHVRVSANTKSSSSMNFLPLFWYSARNCAIVPVTISIASFVMNVVSPKSRALQAARRVSFTRRKGGGSSR